MSDVRIEILHNGYEVSYNDPDISAANEKKNAVWKDPEVGFVFSTPAEVSAFISKLLPKMMPSEDDMTEFSKSFKVATLGEK